MPSMALLSPCLCLSFIVQFSDAAFLRTLKPPSPDSVIVVGKPATGKSLRNSSNVTSVGDNSSVVQPASVIQKKPISLHGKAPGGALAVAPKNNSSWGVADNTSSAKPAIVVKNDLVNFHAKSNVNGTWGSGVVYFLFMVHDKIEHVDIWNKFFKSAPHGSWKVLVHCKDPAGCARNGVFTNNAGYMQVPTTPTWYCHDLVTAMVQLLTGALSLHAARVGANEKFVFLSESTLPIKPFSEVHSSLLLDDNSDFCLFPADQWGSATVDGSLVKLIKHHQWVVLSRSHAEMLVRDWVPVNGNSEWRIWLKSGAWQGQHRVVTPHSFYYPAQANTCTDEYAFMATIFGALEPMSGARYLPGFGGGHIDMNTHASQGRCRTWSYWNYNWDPAATAVGSEIANDFYGSKISCYPNCQARPAEMEKLSAGSLHALRRSPFLFARKFSPTIWMPGYERIVFDA